jgi:hypothetical protein
MLREERRSKPAQMAVPPKRMDGVFPRMVKVAETAVPEGAQAPTDTH